MTAELPRRRLLTVGGTALFTALAGCSDSDEGSPTPGGSQDGDSSTGETDQREDDGDGTTDGEDDQTNEPGGSAVLSDILNWSSSYAVDIEYVDGDVQTFTQTVHEGDSHIVMDTGGMRMEVYRVDGESYEIVGGRCYIRPNPEAEEQMPDVDDPSTNAPDIESSETTTVDGKSVYVFEMPSEEEAFWYISTETGYPVRFETSVFIARFHSWGETDPISPPDMNCQEI